MATGYEYLTESSPKTVKGEKLNFLTGILYLSPERSSGTGFNVCPYASAGCVATCLNTAGRAGIMRKGESTNAILEARKRRTRAFFANREEFLTALHRDIGKLVRRAERLGMKPAVRLNGTSDLRFDMFARSLFESFPNVVFYDYSKDPVKLRDYVNGRTPKNYHLTFSYHENLVAVRLDHGFNPIRFALANGVSVAVAYSGDVAKLRDALNADDFENARAVVDGDAHDLRFLDAPASIVALKAKGKAKRDTSGFVVRT